eukprot:CAMPEP_0194447154 /NCGR_PEP_ID=MMETSP0176-20130528/128849_1 /TAXON_ID=216777 /ORGANISM="Proboscia alata, Strain PI-D3" /LENGTH=661 /DNA_ID=CAMNT_0039273971 /DNA_START=71 /DNA_END=2057 /DNA_ORIENTATION=-
MVSTPFSNGRTYSIAAATLAAVFLSSSTNAFITPTHHQSRTNPSSSTLSMVTGQQASSFGPATLIRSLKKSLPQIPFLASGPTNPSNKIDIPDHVATILAQPAAPQRVAENDARTATITARATAASADAKELKGMLVGDEDASAWWRSPTPGARDITKEEPLRVLVAGGGLAGLVTAAACHAKGMKVALFEQASSYAPYGGPIQIQSNALRAIQRISPKCFEEGGLVLQASSYASYGEPIQIQSNALGPSIASPRNTSRNWSRRGLSRPIGLKIGYKKGNRLAGLYDAGDWLVRFDTLGPALEAGLQPTIVVDRPVIQQILVKHGFPTGTVRIQSRVQSYEDIDGGGVIATLEDGTKCYADVLVGADGVWSQIRKNLHGLGEGAGGFAASGAAGGAIDDKEARKLARDTIKIAAQADRRYSGFTCYAALAPHRASNIETVSYQILLGEKKYFVSTDGGGERQQWFALIREPAGGVDEEATEENPTPKLDRLRREFASILTEGGDADGNQWDPFALELIDASDESDIKRRDLYDGAPLLATFDPQRLLSPWAKGSVALCGDAAHPMMPNLGQGGCQATEDAYRLGEELAGVTHTGQIEGALAKYSRVRVIRTSIIQGFAQLGSDLLVDFDLMMTIPFLGPFFLTMTQLSMPWILRFLYTPEF